MFLGIEIGGTKLQLGVGSGDGSPLAALERLAVRPEDAAEGILAQIEQLGRSLIDRHGVKAMGIGFGGPVDVTTGRIITSHQIDGWDDFPLADWCRRTFKLPVAVANDSDSAGLAEACFGAGRSYSVVFYTNVGSGIGGALVAAGQLYRGGGGTAIELGHLRPGLDAAGSDNTVEALASGWGIADVARSRMAAVTGHSSRASAQGESPSEQDVRDLLERCGGDVETLSAKIVGEAALAHNTLARSVYRDACQVFGWAIAQAITLLAPNVVVLGGGVPLVGEELFLRPVRQEVDRYVFPPRRGTFEIVPAILGEEVVVHGALAIARQTAT